MSDVTVRKFSTIVKDEREEMLRFLAGLMNDMTKQQYGKATYRILDGDRSGMAVIEVRTSSITYDAICRLIETCYPGLCIFNQQYD